MKKLFMLALVLCLALSLAACDGGAETGLSTGTDNANTTTTPVTTEPPAPPIDEISVTSTSGDYLISLDWEDTEGAEQYEVHYAASGSDDYELLTTVTESEYAYDDANYGQHYDFIIRATVGGEIVGESEIYTAKSNGIRVNEYAPMDDKMVIFCKGLPSGKSDGFLIYINGEIYIYDSGSGSDRGMINYLTALRETWLADSPAENEMDQTAKIAVNFIVSHFHGDHWPAMQGIMSSSVVTVESLYVPQQSVKESDGNRNTLRGLIDAYGHNADFISVPFGEPIKVEYVYSESVLDLYPSICDWGETYDNPRLGWAYTCTQRSGDARITLVLNSNSLWAKFTDPSGSSALFTGDTYDGKYVVDAMLQQYGIENFKSDVVKYLHHGSIRYSAYFQEITDPSITIFSAPEDQLLSDDSILAYNTSSEKGAVYNVLDGDLTITFDHGTITEEGIAPRADGRKSAE